jgi:hypothetical protein
MKISYRKLKVAKHFTTPVRVGDPVHAGDKALTLKTPTQRGRVNRYAIYENRKNLFK